MSDSLSSFWDKVKQNWKSGLTVSLVSLPLNIALSIASGAGPVPGVITGVWAGLIASIFGSSNFNVIGTAGALTTILMAFSLKDFNGLSGVAFLPLLAILTGLVIMIVFALKLERFLIYIPSSVMYGFAAGVAVQIAVNQANDALGLYGLKKHSHFLENLTTTIEHAGNTNFVALGIFLAFLVLLIVWKKKIKQIPGVIAASVLGIGLGHWIENSEYRNYLKTLGEKNGDFDISLINLPDFNLYFGTLKNFDLFYTIFNTALIVALIAILETLITAKLADSITGNRCNNRKELMGLGLANIASGVFGGLPATGVFIRTGLNIKAGAGHRTSSGIAAILTAILAVIFLYWFKYIPMPVFAAILFNVAIGLLEIDKFKRFWAFDRKNFIVGIIVALITIFEDASIGILVGVALALLFFVDKLSAGEFDLTINKGHKITKRMHGHCLKELDNGCEVIVYSLEGVMAYIDAQSHQQNFHMMQVHPELEAVVIRLRDMFYIDIDGLDIMSEAANALQATGKKVLIASANEEVKQVMLKSSVFKDIYDKGGFFDKTEKALISLGFDKSEIGQKSTTEVIYT